jgi:heat shock protein 4
MSNICGIDLGNFAMRVGLANTKALTDNTMVVSGYDLVLNGESFRHSASCVSFNGKERVVGDAAMSLMKTNVKNTINFMKLLVGRSYDSTDVQRELSKAFFKHVKLPHGGIGIVVNYNNKDIVIPVEHALAILLEKANMNVRHETKQNISDLVVTVPAWFSSNQRQSIRDSCKIAGLNCSKVINENDAVALLYGARRIEQHLSSTTSHNENTALTTHNTSIDTLSECNTMFIDIGYTETSIYIVNYKSNHINPLFVICNKYVSGRAIDELLMTFLIDIFQQKHKIDIKEYPKSLIKLKMAVQKAKHMLSPLGVNDTIVSVDCLVDDIDFTYVLRKDEFEKLLTPLLEQLILSIQICMDKSNLNVEDITNVEVIGGTSRVNAIKYAIAKYLNLDMSAMNYGLKTTLNADEVVALGAAMYAVMYCSSNVIANKKLYHLNPRYECICLDEDSVFVNERPDDDDGSTITTTATATTSQEDENVEVVAGGSGVEESNVVIDCTSNKDAKINQSKDAEEDGSVATTDLSTDIGDARNIEVNSDTIGNEDSSAALETKVAENVDDVGEDNWTHVSTDDIPTTEINTAVNNVQLNHQPNDETSNVTAGENQSHEDTETVGVTVDNIGECVNDAALTDESSEAGVCIHGEPQASVNSNDETVCSHDRGTDLPAPSEIKSSNGHEKSDCQNRYINKFTKVMTKDRLQVSCSPSEYHTLSEEDINKCIAEEAEMINNDIVIIETLNKKNELESVLLMLQNKFNSSDFPLSSYISDANVLEKYKSLLSATENWLYEEGYDASKEDYEQKLNDLQELKALISSKAMAKRSGVASPRATSHKQAQQDTATTEEIDEQEDAVNRHLQTSSDEMEECEREDTMHENVLATVLQILKSKPAGSYVLLKDMPKLYWNIHQAQIPMSSAEFQQLLRGMID